LCGLAFETSEIVTEVVDDLIMAEEPGEDITEFLEKELPMTIEELEERATIAESEPDIETIEIIDMLEPLQPTEEEDFELETVELIDMLEPLEVEDEDLAEVEDQPEPELQKEVTAPVELPPSEVTLEPEPEEAPALEEPEALLPEVDIKDLELPESLTWDEDQISEISKEEIETVVVDVWPSVDKVDLQEVTPAVTEVEPEAPAAPEPVGVKAEPVTEKVAPAEPVKERLLVPVEEIPTYEEEDVYALPEQIPVQRMSVNWEYGIYGSAATVALFMVFHTLAPGDYTIALGVIFGTLILAGIYLTFTERGTFLRKDITRSGAFAVGTLIVAFIVLHWSANILTQSTGSLAQPTLDRLLLSIGILLIGVGMVWLRSVTRYVITWFSGTFLLFLSSVTYSGVTTGGGSTLSSTLLVGGVGAILVFISLAFLSYEKAIRRSIDTEIIRGDAEHIRSDYERALVSYDHALDKARSRKPSGPPIGYDVPWYSKGSALVLMGEIEEGLECLDMALAINPNNEVTWVNKGNAHSRMGQLKQAMDCFDRAIHLNPNYEIAWNNKGNILARQKRYIDALRCYNQAIKLNPGYDDVWINKGYVLVKMGKQEEAMLCLSHIKARPAPGTGPQRPVQTA
jgi:hypothetical protein